MKLIASMAIKKRFNIIALCFCLPFLLRHITHPPRCRHSHALLEGGIKCTVTAETALEGQLLNSYRQMGCGSLLVEVDEVVDAQTVDVGIVGGTLLCKVLAEIDAVDAYLSGELGKGYVVLQVELRLLAVLSQQWSYLVADG